MNPSERDPRLGRWSPSPGAAGRGDRGAEGVKRAAAPGGLAAGQGEMLTQHIARRRKQS